MKNYKYENSILRLKRLRSNAYKASLFYEDICVLAGIVCISNGICAS